MLYLWCSKLDELKLEEQATSGKVSDPSVITFRFKIYYILVCSSRDFLGRHDAECLRARVFPAQDFAKHTRTMPQSKLLESPALWGVVAADYNLNTSLLKLFPERGKALKRVNLPSLEFKSRDTNTFPVKPGLSNLDLDLTLPNGWVKIRLAHTREELQHKFPFIFFPSLRKLFYLT